MKFDFIHYAYCVILALAYDVTVRVGLFACSISMVAIANYDLSPHGFVALTILALAVLSVRAVGYYLVTSGDELDREVAKLTHPILTFRIKEPYLKSPKNEQ